MLTLGINYSKMYNSSACIVRDGELLFAVAEERLSRLKHDARFLSHPIQESLEFTGVRVDQLDDVCFGWQTPGHGYRHDLKLFATGKWQISYMNVLSSTRHFLCMWHQEGEAKRFTQDLERPRRG
jgi:predicted NodU family carbamoyl transferase